MTDPTWLAPQVIWSDDHPVDELGAPIRLAVGVCAQCRRSSFPSTGFCTWCGSATERQALGSVGRVKAATAVLHKTPGSELEVPYLIALVRFDSAGLDILGVVTGTTDLDQVPIDQAVTVVTGPPFSDGRRHYVYAVGDVANSDSSR